MKIRSITLTNVRRFTDSARISGISDGLNLLCEPNEHGKSTLFDAIQALFFIPHGSRKKEVTSLQPHAGGAPEVSMEVETPDGLFRISKRWLKKPVATVHRGTGLVAQSDAAEAWIADLLGRDSGGPSGLIWVRQGLTGLLEATEAERKLSLDARRDLMSSVGHEVEAMTGGRRMDAALRQCREELAALATGTGRPKVGGPWKTAQDEVERLEAERETLAATARDLQEALTARARARRELAEWEDPDAVTSRQTALETARSAHAAAQRHAETIDSQARTVDLVRLKAQAAQARLAELSAARDEQTAARQELNAADTKARAALHARTEAQAARDTAQARLDQAEADAAKAEALRNAAQQAQAARDGADRRTDLTHRIAQAEEARRAMETAAAGRIGPDAAILRRIDTLAGALTTARAARDATVTQVVAHYTPGREGTIRAGGTALPDGHPVPLPRVMRLDLDGIGQLEVRPGDTVHDDSSVDAADRALRAALTDAGVADVDGARTAAATRAKAEQAHDQAKAVLNSLAPDGIEVLRSTLARIPVLDSQDETPDPAAAETALAKARTLRDTARAARDSAAERLADARDMATRAEAAREALADRLRRADETLAAFGSATPDSLAIEAAQSAAALAEAETAHATLTRDAPDLASTGAALTRAESVQQRAQDEIAGLRPLLARLDERITRSFGDAVEERLADIEQALGAARAALSRVLHEVAVLQRLEQALDAARSQARDRYFAPIVQELKPLLRLLWPEADLTWGEESLLPEMLIREGREEPIDILSGGTQEQVALLVRLAFARMLARSGHAAPVILDDALVFSDDDRIERMFDALHRQAGDLQIIVLSCRQRAFSSLGGTALRLLHMAPETTG
ncbi:MAG: chromosome segregation protein SMC [Pseudooceanicola sp.]|nr:chromosome segregation protein SMC [Pseudooceanicola sp.]